MRNFYFGVKVEEKIKKLISNSVKSKLNYYQATPEGGTFNIKFKKLE